jgi:hypothetical protein
VTILWWLAAPVTATVLAMLWATWSGRPRQPLRPDQSSDAYDRFTDALRRPLPDRARVVVRQQPERVAGVALRPRPEPDPAEHPRWRPGGPPRPITRRMRT